MNNPLRMCVFAFVVAGGAAGALSPAWAGPAGPYIFGGVGRADFSIHQGALDGQSAATGTPLPSTIDRSSTGFKLGAGYAFDEHFAVEGGFDDLRHFSYTNAGGGSGIRYDARVWNLFGVGSLPVTDEASVFAKLGVADSRLEADVNESTGYSMHKGFLRPAFGLGAQYDFTSAVGMRLEYENFGRVGNEADFQVGTGTGRGSLSLVSVSAVVHF